MTVLKVEFNENFHNTSLLNGIHKEYNIDNGIWTNFLTYITDMLIIYRHINWHGQFL